MYSDILNKLGKQRGLFIEKVSTELYECKNHLRKCIQKLKAANSFVVFGGGDRCRQLIDVLYEKYNVKPNAVLINRKYMNGEKVLLTFKRMEISIVAFEDYICKHNDFMMVLGIPRMIVPDEVLSNARIDVIDFSFSMSAQGEEQYLSEAYLKENIERLAWVNDMLADRYSQDAYFENIVSRATGRSIKFCKAPWSDPQYFLEDLMKWRTNECLVDGGAYVGDTVDEFLKKIPPMITREYEVFSFEPDKYNCEIFREEYRNNNRIHLIEKGLYSEECKLYFDKSGESGIFSESKKDAELVEVTTIDHVLESRTATFIKLDVEGSELLALQGAKMQIMNYKPRLAVCLYHKPQDLYEIPLYIYMLNPKYKFYIRPHSVLPSELVLYCI